MHFIDDRALPGCAGRSILTPSESGIDDAAFGHKRSAVALVEAEVIPTLDRVAKQSRMPLQSTMHGFGIGIEEQFCWIETVTVFRLVRPGHAEAINRPRPGAGQEAGPA